MREIEISDIKCVLRITADGDVLSVSLSPRAATALLSQPCVTVDVTYNGEVHSFSEEALDAVATFALSEAREVVLSGASLYVDGKKTKSCTFSWDESAGSETVELSYSIDRIKQLYSSTVTVYASAREGLCVRPIELSCTYTDRYGSSAVRRCTLTEKSDGVYVYENSMSDIMVDAGARMQYRLEVAVYADETAADADSGERFLGLSDVMTPRYIISPHHAESAPHSLAYKSPVAGARVKVSWQAHADANTFTLERSCDGGEFVRVYEGGGRSCVDTVPADALTVAYRVSSASSPWWYGESEYVGRTNVYVGTPQGIRAIGGFFVGDGGSTLELVPIMSVGGIK